jgi:hypothetical protein
MIQISYATATDTVKLAASAIIKQAGDVSLQLVFDAAPGEVSSIELSLGSDAATPLLLAFTDNWTQANDTTWNGVLDATDTRLAGFMQGKGPTAVNLELVVTVDGEAKYAPNLSITVQPPIKPGPATSNGGPTYYTGAQVDTAIAAAVQGLAPAATQADLTPAAAVTAPLFAATHFSTLKRKIVPGAGSGAFTAAYTLPVANQTTGAIVRVPVELPASANPTVEIHDNGGTLLTTVTNPAPAAPAYWIGVYSFDGAAWHCEDRHFLS